MLFKNGPPGLWGILGPQVPLQVSGPHRDAPQREQPIRLWSECDSS